MTRANFFVTKVAPSEKEGRLSDAFKWHFLILLFHYNIDGK